MASKRKKTVAKGKTIRLIVSDEKRPSVALKEGMRLEVVATELLGPDLKRIRNIGARLCGGSGTCMALIDLGDEVINPAMPRGRG